MKFNDEKSYRPGEHQAFQNQNSFHIHFQEKKKTSRKKIAKALKRRSSKRKEVSKNKVKSAVVDKELEELNLLGRKGVAMGGVYYHPRYPKLSRLYSEEGRVQILIDVLNGELVDVRIFKTSGYSRLDQASIRAIKKWKFPEQFTRKFVQKISFKID